MQREWILDPLGSPADVEDFLVGHALDDSGPSGCSVVLCPEGAVAGAAVMGSAAGSRQMDGLGLGHVVQRIHGVMFTGGSAFGLGAADGAMAWMEERGMGVDVVTARVPVLPTAVIFDLPVTGGRVRPGPEMGRAACENASSGPMARGNVGAGAGATVGKLLGLERACKGGLGGASLTVGELRVAAMAVVNAYGDVIGPDGRVLAGARRDADSREFVGTSDWYMAGGMRQPGKAPENTTLAVVTTNAALDKAVATKVAQVAHHGLVRAIDPVHTIMDGDLVIVMARGGVRADINGLGIMAAHVVRMAILDAVTSAASLPGLPAACDLRPGPTHGEH